MKILLVNKFHYRKGGSETYYFALANALKSAGHDVIFFAMKDEKNIECKQSQYFVKNVDYNVEHSISIKLETAFNLIYSFEAKKKFKELIKIEKPDIVHFNLVHRQITLSIVDVCKKYNIPIVFTMHDLICACPNYSMVANGEICEKCLSGNYLNCIRTSCVKSSRLKSTLASIEAYFYKFHKSYNRISLYITPSFFYKGKLEQSKFTKSPIIHIKNFLPLETQYKLAESNNAYLLYFGRVSKEKGILTLIKAFENSDTALKLYIVGDGPLMQELTQYVNENNLEDKVKFLGFKTGEELQLLIEQCHCVVLPSEWYENGPYSIMEAMSKGKPIIGSNIGGIPELIQDEITGYCFEPFSEEDLKKNINKLNKLSQLEYLLMCKASLEFAKKSFSCENYVAQLVEQYNKLVKGK